MTVVSFVEGDCFTVRIVKYLTTNPALKWANSYELKGLSPGGESELLAAGTALVDFEASFHITTVTFDRILISTWTPDSSPYDPEAFISSTLTAAGERVIGGQPEALNVTFSVARIPGFGRFGHVFYRGVLEEGDVQAPAGTASLTSRVGMQGFIDTALASSSLEDYLAGGSGTPLSLVMVGSSMAEVRDINQLRAQGVTTLPLNHAWFNRTPPA